MDVKTICNTLRPLFDLTAEVHETNAHYQQLLAEQILEAGKALDDMTLAEVRQLIERANADFEEQA
ncbi:MAG: hypothetical protein HLX50_08910 [Alteromonadaceae bacterium]|nr:hypothetical protein [Alteromonadaceae bacterium]